MNRTFWLISLLLALLAAGCGPASTVAPLPTLTLDATGATTTTTVKASAVVSPVQDAQLSFVISGLVKEVIVEEGQQVQKGQTLAVLDTLDLEFAVTAAEAALRSAELEAAIQRYRRKYTNDAGRIVYLSGPREQIVKADAKVAQSKAALETAKAALLQGALVAPFEGAIIDIKVSVGEYAQPGQGVIILADLETLQVETTDLSELNVDVVEVGQPASVFVEALNQSFPGKVSDISPISETIGGDVVFKVTIQLNEQPPALLWGMSADVEIDTE